MSSRVQFIVALAIVLLIEAALLAVLLTGRSARTSETDGSSTRTEASPSAEVRIGQFQVTSSSLPDIDTRINMTVYAQVPKAEQKRFDEVFASRQARIRDAITLAVRTTDPAVVREPELRTLKRMLKKAIHEALGRDGALLEEVIVPDFRVE